MENSSKIPYETLNRFFEEPGGHIVLDKDLRIVEVGPEYLRMTLSRREDLLGKLYINTITEPNAKRHEAALDQIRRLCSAALKTHQTQKYSSIRTDIQSAFDGHIEERWWEGAFIPLLVGEEIFIIHRIRDITLICVVKHGLDSQRRSNYILYALVMVAFGLGAWGFGKEIRDNHHLAKSTCQRVEKIDARISALTRGQLIKIHTPGTALYRFYHRNPDLLQEALSEAQSTLQDFQPTSC